MRVGIISDTHGLLRPEAIRHLAGTDHPFDPWGSRE
jgi:predicted phosphodiesterase